MMKMINYYYAYILFGVMDICHSIYPTCSMIQKRKQPVGEPAYKQILSPYTKNSLELRMDTNFTCFFAVW